MASINRAWLRTMHLFGCGALGILLLLLNTAAAAASEPPKVGIAASATGSDVLAAEWRWALRGGGADMELLDQAELANPPPAIRLIIVDAVPLTPKARSGLAAWIEGGGLLIAADAAAALQTLHDGGAAETGRDFPASELLGGHFAGYDAGQIGAYPRIVTNSPLLSPLLAGDALRFGTAGGDSSVVIEPAATAQVLARSARLSPGPGGLLLLEDAPTIVTQRYGSGRVVFLTFSPAKIAACYPTGSSNVDPIDCGGAGSAHALMRWLTANLLWEEKHLQIPLLMEAPGHHAHVVLITGDVHNARPAPPKDGQNRGSAGRLAELAHHTGVPLSLFFEGDIGRDTPQRFGAARRAAQDLEISSHGWDGTPLTSNKFLTGRYGIRHAFGQAHAALGIPDFPANRPWLLSFRSHGWLSDTATWWAMQQSGVGLAFDFIFDQLGQRHPWRVPPQWLSENERLRLSVPLYEHSIRTADADFRLAEEQSLNIALLAGPQADPPGQQTPFAHYADYVRRWHQLFARLAAMGGITEVWLWHPEGVAVHHGFADVENLLTGFRGEPSTAFVRGDVAANWRANRERYRVAPQYGPGGTLTALALGEPAQPLYPLPPGAPDWAATVGYWVVGDASLPQWQSNTAKDPYGRTVTVLTHAIATPGHRP